MFLVETFYTLDFFGTANDTAIHFTVLKTVPKTAVINLTHLSLYINNIDITASANKIYKKWPGVL